MSDSLPFSLQVPDNFHVRVRVPATSANLGPGFDALGLALDLWNELTLRVSEHDSLTVKGEGTEELAGVSTTIAHDAAKRVFSALNVACSGVELQMQNGIPLSRGLGSSSAAIVGGLVGANEWARQVHGVALSSQQLLDLANEIEGHPDNVAPALLGGLIVAASNETGQVTAVSVPVQQWPRFVVWIPQVELATSHARSVLPDSISRGDAIFNLSRSALLVAALTTGEFTALPEALQDRIHQNQRAPLVPGFWELTGAASQAGSLATTLSGAGPTILFWCSDESTAQAVASAVTEQAKTLEMAGKAVVIDAVTRGAYGETPSA